MSAFPHRGTKRVRRQKRMVTFVLRVFILTTHRQPSPLVKN